jgi:hypothetical protein
VFLEDYTRPFFAIFLVVFFLVVFFAFFFAAIVVIYFLVYRVATTPIFFPDHAEEFDRFTGKNLL